MLNHFLNGVARSCGYVLKKKLHYYFQMVIYVEASFAGSLFSGQLPSDTSGKFTFFYNGFFSRIPTFQVK